MIAATCIQDQELAIAPKRTSVNDPPVTRSRNLGAHMGGDRLPLLGSTDAVRAAKFADFRTVNRKAQMAAHGGKSHRGRKPARVLERRERGTGGVLFDRAGLLMGAARRRRQR